MKTEFDELDMRHRIEAFADGELPPDQRLAVMEYLADHPEAMKKVCACQRMRDACRKVIEKTCGCGCSGELKRRIAEMAESEPIAMPPEGAIGRSGNATRGFEASAPAWKPSFSRWTPLAAAAVFFIAAIVALNLAGKRDSLGDGSVLPVSQVEQFQWRHTRCSRAIDALVAGDYPQDIQQLPGVIADVLGHQPYPVLDLSKMGYVFDRSGPCSLPGSKAIHLIYKAAPDSGRSDSLSLWIEPDDGKLLLEPGKPYRITGQYAAHPMLVWKHNDMVYYLVGDSDRAVQEAVTTLNTAG